MIDFKNFKIKRGPSKDLHDPRLIVEEGYWYLSTDKAELFIGIEVDGVPQLKPINDTLFEAKLANYATVDFVEEALKSIDIPEINVDDFATKEELNNKADTSYVDEKVANIVNSEGLATEEWVESQNYLTAHQDISGKQDIIDDLEEIRTGAALGKTALQEIPAEYAKKDELFNKDYNELINKPKGLATESFVLERIAEAEIGEKEIDLSEYAKKEDLFSRNYNDLENKPAIPEAYDDSELRNLINSKADSIHSHEEYALVEHIHDQYLTENSQVIADLYNEVSVAYGIADGAQIAADEAKDLANQANTGITEVNQRIDNLNIPSIEGLASEQFVSDEIAKIELKEGPQGPQGAPGKDGIDGKDGEQGPQGEPGYTPIKGVDYFDGKDGQSAYEIWLAEGNAGTEDDFLASLKGDKGNDGLATQIKVNEVIYNVDENGLIELPKLVTPDALHEPYDDSEIRDLINGKAASDHTHKEYSLVDHKHEEYAKKDELPTKVSELENDANYTNEDKVLNLIKNNASTKIGIDFVTDITVGHLAAGTAISKDMTISQLVYRILFAGSQPDEPEVLEGIIGEIITNELPLYYVDNSGSLIELPFEITTLTEEQAAQEPTKSGFYQVVDGENNVKESGYHDLSVANQDLIYMVALPKSVKAENISVQTYSDEEQIWEDNTFELTDDISVVNEICDIYGMDISNIDTDKYTVWVSASENVCTGSKIRYIITE